MCNSITAFSHQKSTPLVFSSHNNRDRGKSRTALEQMTNLHLSSKLMLLICINFQEPNSVTILNCQLQQCTRNHCSLLDHATLFSQFIHSLTIVGQKTSEIRALQQMLPKVSDENLAQKKGCEILAVGYLQTEDLED